MWGATKSDAMLNLSGACTESRLFYQFSHCWPFSNYHNFFELCNIITMHTSLHIRWTRLVSIAVAPLFALKETNKFCIEWTGHFLLLSLVAKLNLWFRNQLAMDSNQITSSLPFNRGPLQCHFIVEKSIKFQFKWRGNSVYVPSADYNSSGSIYWNYNFQFIPSY